MRAASANSPRTATEGVLERLRTMLVRGELLPGTRMDQHELARRFGVSIVPLREAMARLEGIGLVRIHPHRGAFVAEVSLDELQDIYTIRKTLEEQAARLAAARLSDADIVHLEDLSKAMHGAAQSRNFDLFLAKNRAFHFVIYRAAGRPHMLRIIEGLWELSARYAHLQLYTTPERADQALFEIRAITDAARRRDAEALALMLRFKLHQTTVGLAELAQGKHGEAEQTDDSGHAVAQETLVTAGRTQKRPKPHTRRGKDGSRRLSR